MRMRWVAVGLALGLAAGGGGARAASLYSDLGERPGLVRIVDAATAIWLKDPKVGPTFEETNIGRFKRLLVDQLCQVSGGDCGYRGRTMRDAHKGLHLSTAQFNAVAEDLQAAMRQLGVAYPVQSRLIALLAPMHRDVVSQ